jgi:hypothetical protein
MCISVDLGNQQKQIGTVDKCKKKEQTNHANHSAWMLTSIKFQETLRLHWTSQHGIIKNYATKCNYLQYLIDLICTNIIAMITSDQSIFFAGLDALVIHPHCKDEVQLQCSSC